MVATKYIAHLRADVLLNLIHSFIIKTCTYMHYTGIYGFIFCRMEQTYAIVCFCEEDDAVGVVPYAWCLDKGKCSWPPYMAQEKINKAVKQGEKALASWPTHQIRILAIKGKRQHNYNLVKAFAQWEGKNVWYFGHTIHFLHCMN